MSFHGVDFVFDNVPSEEYGLIMSSSGGESSSAGSVSVEIISENIFRKSKSYFYGTTQNKNLEFEVMVSTLENEITAEDSALIQMWLFGHQQYKELRIVQPDMEDYYFNCILLDPQVNRVGNIIRGFTFTVSCDSPFAWGQEISEEFTNTSETIQIYNKSENNDYTYPYITINVDGDAGNFLIRNITDNNREFSISGMEIGETVTVDCDRQIVEATLSVNILDKIQSPILFFRLLPGLNNVYVEGNYTSFEIAYVPVKRMV